MKTTPVTEMEKTAHLSQESRRQYKVLVHSEKARRLPSHPLHSKLQNRPKCRLNRQSLCHIVRNLNSEKGVSADTDIEPLTPDICIPRQHTTTIRANIPEVEKKTKNPDQQKTHTLDTVHQQYPPHSWIQAYTDDQLK